MSGPSRRAGTALLLAVVLLGATVFAPSPASAVGATLDHLDDARTRVGELEDDLAAVTARYERTWAEVELVRREIADLEDAAVTLEASAAASSQAISDRARSVYKHGTDATIQLLLNSEGPQATVERSAMLQALQLREQVDLERAVAGRLALEQTRQLITERERRLDLLRAEIGSLAASLQRQLVAAEEEVATLRTLAERQRRIDRGAQQGIYSCIFAPGASSFRDTWGAPRSGGRTHKGTDVFAAMRAPVYAFTSGVIERHSSGGLGGIAIYLRGDDGNRYYYAHLDNIEPAAHVGARVVAGALIARNGYTGNADRWAPHVHFELHPGGGSPVNPYPWLAAACK